nr:hypothetical protein [Streptomyces echinoruber]
MAERGERAVPDSVLTRIGQVVMLHHAGDREEARGRLLDLWAEIGEDGDPLHRCTLAHYLADTQDDPADELAWDLRALSAAQELAAAVGEAGFCEAGFCEGASGEAGPGEAGPGEAASGEAGPGEAASGEAGPGEAASGEAEAGSARALQVRALYPSLHLNLAADYVKLGRREAARLHLRRARGAAGALADDGYGEGVRAAIHRLALRLGEEDVTGDDGPWGPPRQEP